MRQVAIPFDPGQVSTVNKRICKVCGKKIKSQSLLIQGRFQQLLPMGMQFLKLFVSQSLLIQGRFQQGVIEMERKSFFRDVAIPFDPGQVSTN